MVRHLKEKVRNELVKRLTATDHPFDAVSSKNSSMCKCGLSITDASHQPQLRFQPPLPGGLDG
jgi:hypothetical protein